ncbi:class E basic helix-loop-helix protein 40-like [Cyprinodon tularosa]|uniref:class E basic helix-loop-helix protein 40-like n=1 Tax=Cyprinodon tularosa TaxID=77115 RepID=UPI0018E22FD3|nr:class E basic helix-loop-helix protein 40-like [Cyprinodon tularosa]
MERITSAQPPPYVPKHASMDTPDMHRMEYYMCKSRRGVKSRDECKETYKLPHRLIEKKRRDRINECIAQLKDLLPEHLKLTTLGHLEKAVVLELTLKHVKTLSAILEQQQQKILALQKDLQINDQVGDGAESNEDMFRSGFDLCAREVLHYLANQETSRDLTPSHIISHIEKVAAEVLQHGSSPRPGEKDGARKPVGQLSASPDAPAKNCVPVIQRTFHHGTGEQSGSDTDTDSGYGGEHDKPKSRWLESHGREGELKTAASERTVGVIKQEGDEPQAKRLRVDSEDEIFSFQAAGAPGGYMNMSASQPPFCLPFYFIPPSTAAAAAAYLPMLEKCWYPSGMPIMYPGLAGSAAGLVPETLPSSLLMSPRAGSPIAHRIPMDSPALHKALKQVSPLNSETKD